MPRKIHDALWVECPEREAEQVRHLMTIIMTAGDETKGSSGSGYQMTPPEILANDVLYGDFFKEFVQSHPMNSRWA